MSTPAQPLSSTMTGSLYLSGYQYTRESCVACWGLDKNCPTFTRAFNTEDYQPIGRAETAHLNRSFTELFKFAAGIRCRLGKQTYLLDEYISLLLEGANAMLVHSAAEDGFAASAELRHLCLAVMDGKTDSAGHPLYEKFEAYIAGHPLPYQERVTRLNLYCIALAGDYLECRREVSSGAERDSAKKHWTLSI